MTLITTKIQDLGDCGEFFIKIDTSALIAVIDKLDDTYDPCGDRGIRSDDLRWYESGFNAARDEIVRLLKEEK